MRKLLKFETFKPKNLEDRQQKYDNIIASKLAEYQKFKLLFETNFKKLIDKYQVVMDEKEALFTELMVNCHIQNSDQNLYNYKIYLESDGLYYFIYNWYQNVLDCHTIRVWYEFRDAFNMSFKDFKKFIQDMFIKHFDFKPEVI